VSGTASPDRPAYIVPVETRARMTADPLKSLTVPYRAGERIVVAGEEGACVFVVQAGSVRLSRRGRGAPEPVEIAVLGKGDVFGEASLVDSRPYGIDAVALTDCEVLELGPQTFQQLLKARPEVAVRVLRQLSSRVEQLEERLVEKAEQPRESHPAAPERPAARVRNTRLVLEDGGIVFPLKGPEMLVGRYDPVTEIQPEVDLGPLDTKRSVSRRHARLAEKDGTWTIREEEGALNGTFVNGVKIREAHAAPLSEGDVVSLGMVRLVYREG
jgi:CRP-like cAMP-binding protein